MRKQIPARHAQRGAILVTSILILLILTVIGITAMQVTRMQERMAGNSRDTALAFQGAEAALRDAEQRLFDFVIEPVKCLDPAESCSTLYERDVMVSMADNPGTWWESKGQQYGKAGVSELAGDGLKEDPRFATEELMHIRNCLVMDSDCGRRTVYQVTGRSTGGSGEATVLLQTTYAKPPY